MEVLSIELWREIFDYFNGIELWYSFRDLNAKINSILDQTQLHLNFNQLGNYTYFLKHLLPVVNIENVRTLKINQKSKIQYFFSSFSLDSMTNLRRLSLTRMYSLNDNTFLFWKQLASLPFLRSLKIHFADKDKRGNSSEEIEFILQAIFHQHYCPLLETLILNTNRSDGGTRILSSLVQTTQPTKIKCFSMDELAFCDLMKLAPGLKNLRALDVNFEFSFEEITDTIPLFPKCVQLHLDIADRMDFEQIEHLLTHTPKVKDLCLWSCQYNLLDARKWQRLFSSQCSDLIKFELRCTGDDDDMQFDHAWRSFEKVCERKPFWIQRNASVSWEAFGDEDFYHAYVQFNTKKSHRCGRTNSHRWKFGHTV